MRVAVEGELDIAQVDDLRTRLREASAASAEVEIDLSSLEFIDAAGVHCLIDAARDAARGGGRIRIEGTMRPQVRRVFALLRQVIEPPPALGTRAA